VVNNTYDAKSRFGELTYRYMVNDKEFTGKTTIDSSSNVFEVRPVSLELHYLQSNPAINRPDLSVFGIEQNQYEEDSTSGAIVLLFLGLVAFFFGLANLLIGLGIFPPSWTWGNKANKFGLIAAGVDLSLSGIITWLTLYILKVF
jgi:hypothetical protein